MESLERFVMLATSNDITRAAVDHGHVSWTNTAVVDLARAPAAQLRCNESTLVSKCLRSSSHAPELQKYAAHPMINVWHGLKSLFLRFNVRQSCVGAGVDC
jgi:hypothetical protein